MRVLNVVTYDGASFFEKQVETLAEKGVASDTVAVSQEASETSSSESSRSVRDYVRTVVSLLKQSQHEYDLIHIHYGLLSPLALVELNRPVVVTFWGSDLMAGDWVSRVSRTMAHHCDEVIVPSSAMSTYLSRPHHVIPFGVDVERFRPIPRDEARARIGWETDANVVLFPYRKTRAVKNYPRARAVVERADVDAELRWITGVPYEEMPYYMNASDAVIVTSDREAGPMVIKEAAACNVPVVSTDVGFAREALGTVRNSTVGATDDELVSGLERALRSGTGSDGRKMADEWSLDRMGDRILAVYRSALERPTEERESEPNVAERRL
ncbi:glycosyltransferase [Halogeometricum luteum]|uniref:Glycosyltransferase n=1 Tax=Halogeometricum luteum TaxID=2950537 RepID=A0ABU2G371_9EURY|nr:glycosyltransferase [Halogeometricum sp. S3BR5-2]MDS0295237.1 glycosyltransferase [Halogeometricum sp. S3BR5-2]